MEYAAEIFMSFLANLWSLLTEAAPWLLVGLVAAGLIQTLIPTGWMNRWLGDRGFGSVLRAAVIGTPLPLCSCGVLPAAMGLRRGGASRGATVSFLVATPENGADSIALSYVLLGPLMMIARPVAALFSALMAGALAELAPERDGAHPTSAVAGREGRAESAERNPANRTRAHESTCCSNASRLSAAAPPAHEDEGAGGVAAAKESAAPCCSMSAADAVRPEEGSREAAAIPASGGSCCSGGGAANPAIAGSARNGKSKIGNLYHAVVDVLDDIKLWLGVGLVVAAAVATFLPPETLGAWGEGFGAMLLMLVVGLPMYICATASTPLAGALLLAGVSPGAVLVFLLAGPATNLGTIMVVRREMGRGTLIGYLAGVCGGALAGGLAVNAIVAALGVSVVGQISGAHQVVPSWFAGACAVFVILAAIRPLRRGIERLGRGGAKQISAEPRMVSPRGS